MSRSSYKFICKYPNCENKYMNGTDSLNKHFYSFPAKNSARCDVWRNFCKINSVENLSYSFLCEDHFDKNSFINVSKHRLNRNAVPTIHTCSVSHSLCRSSVKTTNLLDANEENKFSTTDLKSGCNNVLEQNLNQINSSNEVSSNHFTKRNKRSCVQNLPERKRKSYKFYRNEQIQVIKSKKKKLQINCSKKYLKKIVFNEFSKKSNKIPSIFIKPHLKKLSKKGKGQYLLPALSFQPGLNELMLNHLKIKVQNMKTIDKNFVLLFDEISLAEGLYYNKRSSTIIGYEDLGFLGKKTNLANHALVFMIRGIHKNIKQPIAYYFISGSIQTLKLKSIIVHIIEKLFSIGVNIVATICKQSTTNQVAIRLLQQEQLDPGPYFTLNSKKIVTIFDPPHLLKSTRNALLTRNIIYDNDKLKIAKWDYILKFFESDQQLRFKQAYKLKPEYFKMKDSRIKMKVTVAAQQLSNTVAAGIETLVLHNNSQMPEEAMHTAEFVHSMDSLFDSMNGNIFQQDQNKTYRCVLSKKSRHIIFWRKMKNQISRWKFINKKTGLEVKKRLNFQKGWVTTLGATEMLWTNLRNKGFKFLNTRCLNQDPLENLFCVIRQHSVQNSKLQCHQFITAFKISILSGLTAPIHNSNCEEDECKLFDNLTDLLNSSRHKNVIENNENVSYKKTKIMLKREFNHILEKQSLAYVSGYILRKMNNIECESCKLNIFTKHLSPCHIFTTFKEYKNNKFSLIYANENFTSLLRYLHSTVYSYLEQNGSDSNLFHRLKNIVLCNITLNWFSCTEHKYSFLDYFLNISLHFLLYKYCHDKSTEIARNKYKEHYRRKYANIITE